MAVLCSRSCAVTLDQITALILADWKRSRLRQLHLRDPLARFLTVIILGNIWRLSRRLELGQDLRLHDAHVSLIVQFLARVCGPDLKLVGKQLLLAGCAQNFLIRGNEAGSLLHQVFLIVNDLLFQQV